MIGAVLTAGSCADIDDQIPEGGSLTANQLKESTAAMPERINATFTGMYDMMYSPGSTFPARPSARPDDFGFAMIDICNDFEGADMVGMDNGYNWLSTSSELSSRNADYANPMIRYNTPYKEVGACNEILAGIPAGTTDKELLYKAAQARAMRAFSYMKLAPNFQGSYAAQADQPCIPLLTDGVDFTHNPRATVKQVYEYILEDLNFAVTNLEGFQRPNKAYIDLNVAYGLRARIHLMMGHWAEAAADAEKAMAGYTPLSIDEVKTLGFCDINSHNWMWGIMITNEKIQSKDDAIAANPACWLSPVTSNGYGTNLQCLPCINKLLFDKIPQTDARKNWWLNENLESAIIDKLTWNGYTGVALAKAKIMDGSDVVKDVFLPYTSMKFGSKAAPGTLINDSDWPLMRVEEMYLIAAEGYAKSGQEAKAKEILENFVKTYRDPQYSATAGGRSLVDEIWYQRRVELWGEGFSVVDTRRLGKPFVRFHGPGTTNNPDAFTFNIAADDPWLNMRFPTSEKDNNLSIVDNTGGSQPVAGQNPNLRDGVTD
jgi:hypothetical protein